MRICVILAGLYCLLAGTPAFGGNRLDLPQVSAEVNLPLGQVESVFEMQPNKTGEALPARETYVLISSLPADFRNGCSDMTLDYGPQAAAQTTWAWSVRVLHAESGKFGQSALLAFRCTAHVPDVTYSDERRAILLNGQKTTLKLLALDKDCDNCSDLYHFEFVQRFNTENGYFAELRLEHTTENPCCDGGDTDKGARFLLVTIPLEAVALSFDKETYFYNHDDQDGDTETECKSVVTYDREAGNLLGVNTQTSCTENGKPKPPVMVTRYRWDRTKERFESSAAASSQKSPK
jgi:hypothetical protein